MDDLDRLSAQLTPAGFAYAAGGGSWQPFPHLVELSERLAEAASTPGTRLIVTMPPRHGKSELISRYFPAWYLGLNPDRKVMLASYEARFAASWGRKARDVLREMGPPVFGVDVSDASQAAESWEVARHEGVMTTAGIGGALTGKGADILIIDDPVKNAEEAQSEVMRERAWDWWQSTARTRLQPGGSVVLVLTRWHEDDLAGRLLQDAADGGEAWEVLNLPAIAGQEDPLSRAPGEALCREMFDLKKLEQTRRSVGPYWWSAMYQQMPAPEEGGLFERKYFSHFRVRGDLAVLSDPEGGERAFPLSECVKATYVDLAASVKTTADYTVALQVWITPKRDLLIANVERARIPGPEQPDWLDKHRVGTLKVEQIGYQTTLIQALRDRGIPVEPLHPDKDKVTRASAAGALYRQGKIFHLKGAPWLADLEHELLTFPAGAHDDQVDTVAYAARDLSKMAIGESRTQRSRGKTLTGGLLTMQL